MTTWTAVDAVTNTYSDPSDEENNYVVSGYVANGYIDGAQVWSVVASVSTTWAAA